MNWRRLLLFASFVAVMILILVNVGQFTQFIHIIGHIRWYLLGFVIVAQVISYYAIAKYYESVFSIFEYHIPLKQLYKLGLAVNFVNTVFPTGGFSGTSYLSYKLQSKVPVGKTTLTQLMYYVFTYISFLVVLALGFMLLFWGGGINRLTERVILLMILGILVGSAFILTIIKDRPRVEAIVRRFVARGNRLLKRFSKRKKRQIEAAKLDTFFDEFYEGYNLFLKNPWQWRKPLLYTLLCNIAEISTVYVVFFAFGNFVNYGAVIVAYLIANVISLASLFAGGIGFYEAAMVATMVALGLPLTTSLSVVLVYRVLNFWLFLPVGWYYYRKLA